MSEHLSNTQLKNRLLGAGILVLAAVILIPLFLGDPKYVVEPEPEAPKSTEFESRIQPLPGTVQSSQSTAETGNNEAPESGGLVLKKLDNQQPPAAKKPNQVDIQPLRLDKLDSRPVSEPKKTQQVVAPAPKANPKPVVKKAAPAKTAPSTPKPAVAKISAGWAVQAGIFSKVENARAIAEILKSNGYAPNVSDAKASFGKAKRVWLGPFATKREAQSISKRLEQQTGNGGYVAVYPFKS